MANQHVVKRGSDWAIRKEKSNRDTALFPTQGEAWKAARKIADNQNGDAFLHGRNGKIRERSSFGNDPFPPKG